jgi:hypothetical protein
MQILVITFRELVHSTRTLFVPMGLIIRHTLSIVFFGINKYTGVHISDQSFPFRMKGTTIWISEKLNLKVQYFVERLDP